MSKADNAPNQPRYLKVTRHLILQALQEDDGQEFYNLIDQNRDYLARFLPWVPNVKTVDDTIDFIRTVAQERAEHTSYGFGMYIDGELVGHISLMHVADEQTPEIGYWIAERAAGHGTTTEAARAITNFGFNDIKLTAICIKADKLNYASNRVAEKLGYRLRGDVAASNGQSGNYWLKERTHKNQN